MTPKEYNRSLAHSCRTRGTGEAGIERTKDVVQGNLPWSGEHKRHYPRPGNLQRSNFITTQRV